MILLSGNFSSAGMPVTKPDFIADKIERRVMLQRIKYIDYLLLINLLRDIYLSQ